MTETAPSREGTREKLWTPANVVTLVRICCVPVFVIAIISPWPTWFPDWEAAEEWKPWIAAGIFILLAATDGVDGYLARSRGEVTNLGKFMDPLADKILVAAALLALVELSVLPSWVALVILAREFIVSGLRMVAASQGVVIAASWYGKAKTVAQIIAIVLFIIKDSVVITTFEGVLRNPLYLASWAVMAVALVLTIVSMLDYFVKAREILGFSAPARDSAADAQDGAVGKCDERVGGQAVDADASSVCSLEGETFHEDRTSGASSEKCGGFSVSEVGSGSFDLGGRTSYAALAQAGARVVEQAVACGLTVGTAESLTGGLIAGTLTSVPGSSAVVRGGIVSYVNDVKRDSLGVDADILEREGAVSREVACQMAQGARIALGVDVAVAVTGIAGPGGAEPGKPVGTVWMGLADARGVRAECFHFSGDRDDVRAQTVLQALTALESALEER